MSIDENSLDKLIAESGEGVAIHLHVKPSAKKTLLSLEYGELVFYTREPPVGGKANASLIKYLSKLLGVPQSRIEIVRGGKSRDKVVLVKGVSREEVLAKIMGVLK